MNNDVIEGNWTQMKGHVKQFWAKLTDDEIDKIDGQFEEFVGRVQERYGYSKEDARNKVNEFLKDYKSKSETQ